MAISTGIDFYVIEPNSIPNSYLSMVGHPWGRKMKSNISLGKDIIKIKGNKEKVTIPFDPRERRPWDEPSDEDADVWWLYQIMQNNEDIVEPKSKVHIYLGSPMSVDQNSNSKLYN